MIMIDDRWMKYTLSTAHEINGDSLRIVLNDHSIVVHGKYILVMA